jgi:hypothetical protein
VVADADAPDEVDERSRRRPGGVGAGEPGLGIRITLEHIAREQRSMDPRTFAVERLGVGDWPRPTSDDQGTIIDREAGRRSPTRSRGRDPVCFAFDVTPDRSGRDRRRRQARATAAAHVEVVEHKRGTGWVAGALARAARAHDAAASSATRRARPRRCCPAARALGVEVDDGQRAGARAGVRRVLRRRRPGALRHLGTPELAAAVAGAATRPLGDAWAWSRKSSAVDISPLVACTLARGAGLIYLRTRTGLIAGGFMAAVGVVLIQRTAVPAAAG